jgi:hypothetical protein
MEKLAIVIGNGEYSDFQKLEMPAKDAEDVAAKLGTLGFEVNCQINQTRGEIFEMLDGAMSKLKRGAPCCVVYYAGHGCVVDGMEYLIPIDGKGMNNPVAAAHGFVGVDQITKMLSKSRTKVDVPIILIFDCCRIGLGQGGRAWGNMNDPRGPSISNHEIANVYVVYSTVRTHVVGDGGNGSNNGPFTEYLLRHLDQPISVGGLAMSVRNGLFEDDRCWNVPAVFTADNLLHPFYFKPREAEKARERDERDERGRDDRRRPQNSEQPQLRKNGV